MIKHLLLSAALACSAVFSASAVTVNDLVGKKCAVVLYGTDMTGEHGIQSADAYDVVKGTTNNQIVLKGFHGSFDLPLTLSNNKLSIDHSGRYTGLANGEFPGYTCLIGGRTYQKTAYTCFYINGQIDYTDCYTPNLSGTTASTTLQRDEDAKLYSCQFSNYNSSKSIENGFILYFQAADGSNYIESYGKIEMLFYDDMGKVITETDNNNNTSQYAGYAFAESENADGTGSAAVRNLLDVGCFYESDYTISGNLPTWSASNRFDAKFNYDLQNLTVTMPYFVGGGNNMTGFSTLYANANLFTSRGSSNGSFTGIVEINNDAYNNSVTPYKIHVCGSSSTSKKLTNVTGTLSLYDPEHNADGHTYTSLTANFQNLKYYLQSSNYTVYTAKSVSVPFIDKLDISHFVDLKGVNTDVDKDNPLKITYTTSGTNHFVENEVLYFIPGTYSNINFASLVLDKSVLDKSLSAGSLGEKSFEDACKGLSSGKYTLVCVTKYTAASGLADKVQAILPIEVTAEALEATLQMADFEDCGDKLEFTGTVNFAGASNAAKIYAAPGRHDAESNVDLDEATLIKEFAAAQGVQQITASLDKDELPALDGWYTIVVVTEQDGAVTPLANMAMYHGKTVEAGDGWASDGGTHKVTSVKMKSVGGNADTYESEVITHSVTIENEHLGMGKIYEGSDDYIYISGNIAPAENNHHFVAADSYEIWMLPGNIATASVAAREIEAGKAMRIDLPENYTDFRPTPGEAPQLLAISDQDNNESDNNTLSYNLLVKQPVETSDYTIFVKTNYADTDMTPTWHSLVQLSSANVTTGISDIVVGAEQGVARYYDLQGVEHKGSKLAPGVYIRRQGATATKVIVK